MTRRTYKKPHRAKKKKSILAQAAFWRTAFFMTAIGGTVWLVCFSPALEIKEIAISGTEKVDRRDCVSFIAGEAQKKIAFFDSKSILLLNLDKTKKELMAKFPQIQDIKIERQFPSKIYASIEERRGVARLATGQKSFLVDNDGIAFEEAATTTDLLEIGTGKADGVKAGDTAIKKELLDNILKMKVQIQELAQTVVDSAQVATPERVNMRTSEGWYIYFDPTKDIANQMTKLAAVISDESFKAKRKDLEYLDIRFTRVYLKAKNTPESSNEDINQ
ncbi:MAG: FtsQ-type POTRA domain-containing protein [Candidatus Pacebacteria bacterium]|jgi:cell division septal protein FtsQ|nr:FtsQ-type POTRA domain-containing protein [Candidatus Paceibacterota bacterium]